MKRLLVLIMAAFLVFALSGCEAMPDLPKLPEPETTEPAKEKYIWTISIDDTKSQTYADGELTANYKVHLSASMEGGESPLGEYHGEIRVDYEAVPGGAARAAISILKGSYDFKGWGENDDYSFNMVPYNHEEIMNFVADAYQGAGARLAPILEGTAMYVAEDIPWTDHNWNVWLDAGLKGILSIEAQGNEQRGSVRVETPFGSDSAGRSGPVPLGCTIRFLDENRVCLEIWRHGNVDVNLAFTGTLDKVRLSDTIPVQ